MLNMLSAIGGRIDPNPTWGFITLPVFLGLDQNWIGTTNTDNYCGYFAIRIYPLESSFSSGYSAPIAHFNGFFGLCATGVCL